MTKMNYRGIEYDTDKVKIVGTKTDNEPLNYRGYRQDKKTAAQNAAGARTKAGGHIYRGYKDS